MADKNFSPDMQDSQRDKDHLQQDKATINLPDVEDIPGQENIHVPDLKEMADTTISSDDEEGVGIWNNETPEDASVDPLVLAQQDDLNIGRANRKPETKLDEEEIAENSDDDIQVTDDAVNEDSDVTTEEKEALERTENMDTQDNENLYRSELDNTDFEGEKLNEEIDVSGKDLDVPGAEDDDLNEEIGEEDEENNPYSLGDTE